MTDSDETWGGQVEAAVRETLALLAESSPVHGALAEIAVATARSIDLRSYQESAQAGLAVAALVRELRSTLELLAKGVADDESGDLAKLFEHMSAPVRDT